MPSYFASPAGSSSNPGSEASPWSLAKAASTAVGGDTVFVKPGIYRLDRKIDSWAGGTSENPVVWQGLPDSEGKLPEIRMGSLLSGWAPHTGSIYTAPQAWSLAKGDKTSQGVYYWDSGLDGRDFLTVNGLAVCQPARWPKLPAGTYPWGQHRRVHWQQSLSAAQISKTAVSGGFRFRYSYSSASLPAIADWTKVQITFAPGARWVVEGGICVSATSSELVFDWISTTDITGSAVYAPRAGDYFFLWGSPELLTQAGEFAHDPLSATTYLWMPDSSNPSAADIDAKTSGIAFHLFNKGWVRFRHLRFSLGRVYAQSSSTLADGVEMEHCQIYHPSSWQRSLRGQYYSTGDAGAELSNFAAVRHCRVEGCSGVGISVKADSAVEDCDLINWAYSGNGDGIRGQGARCHAQGNRLSAGGGSVAIGTDGGGSQISRNLSSGSSLITSDNGALFVRKSTSGRDAGRARSEIAWNTVLGLDDAEAGSPDYYPTSGLYFEGGIGNDNFDAHHNLLPSVTLIHGSSTHQRDISIFQNTVLGSCFVISGSSGAQAVAAGKISNVTWSKNIYGGSQYTSVVVGETTVRWSGNVRIGGTQVTPDALQAEASVLPNKSSGDYRSASGQTAGCLLASDSITQPHQRRLNG